VIEWTGLRQIAVEKLRLGISALDVVDSAACRGRLSAASSSVLTFRRHNTALATYQQRGE
jgi:hypothetical protein